MLRPERLASVSIICLRKDVDTALEGLESFVEFHVEDFVEKERFENYDNSLQEAELRLSDAEALIKQFNLVKSSFFQILKSVEIWETEIESENWQTLATETFEKISKIRRQVDNLNLHLGNLREEENNLQEKRNILDTIKTLGIDLEAIEKLKLIHVAVATAEKSNLLELDKALQSYPIILHRCYFSKRKQFLCTAFPSKFKTEIEKILRMHQVEFFKMPEGLESNFDKAFDQISNQIRRNSDKRKAIEHALKKIAETNERSLFSLREIAKNIKKTLTTKQKILQSRDLATIKGFIPKKSFEGLKQSVHSKLKDNALVFENEFEPAGDPPTKIHHSRIIRPFEEITRLYGLPHYEEVDPTPIIAISFPIIFGLMFGDVGYGLLLLIGGLVLGKLLKNNEGTRNFCWIFAACGAGATIVGLLFGEFFGVPLFSPLWFNPFDNVLSFLIFSLFVGVIQIESGLFLELVNFLLKRNFSDAIFTSGFKILFYAGAVYLIASYQLDFGAWFRGPILLVLVPFFLLVFGKKLFLKVRPFWSSVEVPQEEGSLMERFFESGDLVARLLSNTVSYTRILALLMAHYALILVTYVVAGLIASTSTIGLILAGVVVVIGNLFVIGLEGLIVFIHSLRLHFYEWFSKFYQGNGTLFEPFQRKFVRTRVILKE